MPKAVARHRSARLHERVAAHRARVLARRVGAPVSVLIERLRSTESGTQVAMGYSEDYLPVRLHGARSEWLGTVIDARATRVERDALWVPAPADGPMAP